MVETNVQNGLTPNQVQIDEVAASQEQTMRQVEVSRPL